MKVALKQIILISSLHIILFTGFSYAEMKTDVPSDAVDVYSKAIEVSPKDALVYFNRGNAYGKMGSYENAVADFDRAIELNPQYAEAYSKRGFAYNNLGEYRQAVADFSKAIELSPKDAMAYYHRGYAYSKLDQSEKAVADFDKAIELNLQYAAAYNNRGLAYKKLGNYERAIADFDKAIELNPQYAAAYNNRGTTYDVSGNSEKAIADFDKAIELNPLYAMAYNNRGLAYHNLGNHHQAVADYSKALEIDPRLAVAYNNRGAAYDALGNYNQAIADYDKAIELNTKRTAVDVGLSSQSRWIAGLGRVVEENKSRGVAIALVILAVGVLFFVMRSRRKSFADMQDDEMIVLIKEAAQERQFERIPRKEMEYIYHRGFTLATHRLHDDDLIAAVNQFKAEIERRKEGTVLELSSSGDAVTATCGEVPREVAESLYEAVLGEKNCIYYLTKFKDFDWCLTELKESWNWAAFFGGGIWALYRKMYEWFFAFLGVAALCALFAIYGAYVLSILMVVIPWIVFSIYANALYHESVKKKIAAADLSITDKSKLPDYLKYEGGVNAWVIWCCILLPVAGVMGAVLLHFIKR